MFIYRFLPIGASSTTLWGSKWGRGWCCQTGSLFPSCPQICSSLSSYPGPRYSSSARPQVLTSRSRVLTLRQGLRYLTPGQASGTHLQARPNTLTSTPGLRYLQYSPFARPHVLTMPWVLTKAGFQVSTSRSSVLIVRQGLSYLTPGQVSGTRIQARPHRLASRPGIYLQARRYCTHLQARPIVLTSMTRVLTSRPSVLTSRQKLISTHLQARRQLIYRPGVIFNFRPISLYSSPWPGYSLTRPMFSPPGSIYSSSEKDSGTHLQARLNVKLVWNWFVM